MVVMILTEETIGINLEFECSTRNCLIEGLYFPEEMEEHITKRWYLIGYSYLNGDVLWQ